MKIVILGLSITSSWGNGHATTFRALAGALAQRGHRVSFLERDVPWYAENRDLTELPGVDVVLYRSLEELTARHEGTVRGADAVVVGSYVPDGVKVGEWVTATARGVTAFYDIDTPVTLAKLRRRDHEYLAPHLIPRFQVYLSFTGGPTLRHLEHHWGAPRARPLYCAVDATRYQPQRQAIRWDLGYLGTYSSDRQPTLQRLLLEPAQQWRAGQMVVAGPQYPSEIAWPDNVQRIEHLPPSQHPPFYNQQRFTLNVTRSDMIEAGYSPSVRLFEAAACGTPVISDVWDGLETFFQPDREILIARGPEDVLRYLRDVPADRARAIGQAARRRVLSAHTAAHRAAELERYLLENQPAAAAASAA